MPVYPEANTALTNYYCSVTDKHMFVSGMSKAILDRH